MTLPRGTRTYFGSEAANLMLVQNKLIEVMATRDYKLVVVPSIAETQLFIDKAGPEITRTMYNFKDKGDRDICLIPEVTAVVRDLYINDWQKWMKKPVKVQYLQRCYRYDKPQLGRYREFTQFGVEWLGNVTAEDVETMKQQLLYSIHATGLKNIVLKDQVKRGLGYYIANGFEVEYEGLGSQKQIAGGGQYDCGCGWAIGVERLLLAIEHEDLEHATTKPNGEPIP